MHKSLAAWEVGKLGKQTFSLAFEAVVDQINLRIAERNRNTLEHTTENSRMRTRSVAEEKRQVTQIPATLNTSKSATNLAQKGFKVALKHKAGQNRESELPTLTQPFAIYPD